MPTTFHPLQIVPMREIRLAVWHPNESVREAVAARLRGAVVEAHPSPDCDAVMFATVPELAVLDGGMPSLLVAEPCPLREAIESFTTANTVVVNPDRYLPSRQLIRKQLAGPLGEVGLLRLHRWEPPSANESNLLRDIDTTLWLVGKQPDRVFALEQRSTSGRCVQVHLGFPGGGMALLDFDNRLPRGDGYQSLSVIAASGAAYADDHQNTQLVFRRGHPEAVRTEERSGQLAAIAQEFVDAVRAGRDLMTENAASWRAVFAVAAAVEQSLSTGRSVPMEGR